MATASLLADLRPPGKAALWISLPRNREPSTHIFPENSLRIGGWQGVFVSVLFSLETERLAQAPTPLATGHGLQRGQAGPASEWAQALSTCPQGPGSGPVAARARVRTNGSSGGEAGAFDVGLEKEQSRF